MVLQRTPLDTRDEYTTRTDDLGRLVRVSRPLVLVPVLAILFAVAVQPRINRWGSTAAEHSGRWPGDGLADARYTWTNAITINAPAEEVWPWVTQLGQGRAGLYSYDWLENALFAGVHSKNRIMREHQRPLAVGEDVIRMTRYAPYNPIALYLPGRALVLGDVGDTPEDLRAGRARSTWAFIVEPTDADSSRLIVRSRVSTLSPRVQGPIQFVMQRKLMTGIKERAEGTWEPSIVDVLEPLTWFGAAAVMLAGTWFATRRRPDWWLPLAVSCAAGIATGYLLFWQPALAFAFTLDAALLLLLLGDRRRVRSAAG